MSTNTSPSDQPTRRARYGGADPRTRAQVSPRGGVSGKIVAIIMVILLALLVIFVARYLANRQEDTVKAQMTDFERIDDSTFHMDIDVTRNNPSVPSYCIVRALNFDMAEVGRREVLLPPGGEEQQRIPVDIVTRSEAVSGNVYGCSTTIPSYMDL